MENYISLFDKQKAHFNRKVRNSTIEERITKLKRIKKWVFDHQKEIQEALYQDFKKPEAEVDLTEIKPVTGEIDHICSHLHKWARPKSVKPILILLGTSSKIIYEPLGVTLILAPWNFPFNLTIGPLLSAIAAGNCAIVKPSEVTPHTSKLIKEMIHELFDEEEVAVKLGDYKVAEKLLTLPFDHIFFTGGPEVGKKVMKAASKNLSSVTLELGGQNPVIVDETANLRDATEKLLWGEFMNAGQSCISPNRIFVHEDIYETFLSTLKESFTKMYGDKNIKDNPDIARVVNERHFLRVKSLMDDAIERGARLFIGGDHDQNENYIAPTILTEIPEDANILDEEIFGPVMVISIYNDINKIINHINTKEKPLALYVFSTSEKNCDHIIENTSSGTACINETTLPFIHHNLPFGGVNYSGIGKAHGHAGFLAFSNQRSLLKQNVGITSLKLVFPPYNNRVKKFVKLILKL